MPKQAAHILEPVNRTTGRLATFIFIHGLGDDAHGIPLGLAQAFQQFNRCPYVRWYLPNAPEREDGIRDAWYEPKALPSAMDSEEVRAAKRAEGDDEKGILASVAYIDSLIKKEVERGVDPKRIVVGGFSQGCVVSLAWGLLGEMRGEVAGIVPVAGYFALIDRIAALREERGITDLKEAKEGDVQWQLIHGNKDILVPLSLFREEKEELLKWVDSSNVQDLVCEGMGHSINAQALRQIGRFLDKVVPP